MTHMTKDHFCRLLASARTAITDTKLSDADLCAELAEAEHLLENNVVPWTFDIHVAYVDHREGGNLYAAFSREALIAEIAAFCREWWSEISDPRDPDTLPHEEICSIYFEAHQDEYLSTERITTEAPPKASCGHLRFGRHLVISTSHIRPTTADLLDQWAPMIPESRPLGVAESGHGWFVLTDPLDDDALDMIPQDLRNAVAFARRQGCRWLLLDRDADCTDGLETFDW